MNHYGIGSEWHPLFMSFLNDRKQFVELDTKRSILRNSVNCGSIQGSKLSGFLFNIYSNEIPLLPHIINTKLYFKMGGTKLDVKNTCHNIVTFVDDNQNIVSFKHHEKMKSYLENYFFILKKYYNINKIKLNDDKTKLCIIHKNSMTKFSKTSHLM